MPDAYILKSLLTILNFGILKMSDKMLPRAH